MRSGVVNRLSSSGNAIVELEQGHVNLGRLDESVVGEKVKYKLINATIGKCLTEKYTPEGYDPAQLCRPNKRVRPTQNSKLGKRESATEDSNTSTSDPDNLNKLLNGHL